MKLYHYGFMGILEIHKMKDANKTKEQLINKLAKLRQRLAESEASKTQHKGAEEALIESEERASQLKARTFHPRFRLIVSLGLATCIVFVVGHLLGNSWLKVQKGESLPHQSTIRARIATRLYGSNESPDLGEATAFAQGDRKEATQKRGDISMAETFSLQQGLYHKATSAAVHMAEPKVEMPRAGRVVIQVGAFREKAKAELLLRTLGEKGYDGYLDAGIVKNLGLLYRVRLRGYASGRAARAAIGWLEKEEGLKGFFALTVDGGGGRSLTPALQ
jgi:hypothetical protein